MLRVLVVPLDGSELSERALPHAIQLARASGGRLVLVRVALAPLLSGQDWERQQLAAVEEAEQYLAGVAEKVAPQVPVESVVEYGAAATRILEAARQVEADGVVMATHGRAGLAHLLYGSVAEAVLAETPVPVVLVQAGLGQAPGAPVDPTAARLLVALDGSPFAEAALPAAMNALGPSGELILTRIAAAAEHAERDERGRVIHYLDQVQAAREREAADYLESVARRLTAERAGIQVRTDVRAGDPAQGVIAAAKDSRAHLMVMATHGRTGLRRAVLGSVAGEVLRRSATPLLLVRPTPA